jgi:hypothetical protein
MTPLPGSTGQPARTATPTPATTTTFPFDPRQISVSNKLAHDLDRFFKNYRTPDRKPLTEGEVIVGLGFLLGQRLKDPALVQRWLTQIGIAGFDATQGEKDGGKS